MTEEHPPLEDMSDSEYIRGIASYYANSYAKELGHHYARLVAIADRLAALSADRSQE